MDTLEDTTTSTLEALDFNETIACGAVACMRREEHEASHLARLDCGHVVYGCDRAKNVWIDRNSYELLHLGRSMQWTCRVCGLWGRTLVAVEPIK